MKITMIGKKALLGGGVYRPAEQLNLRKKNARPHLDTGHAVEGHHEMTESAALLLREHLKTTGDLIDPAEITGSGKDGRIVKADVQSLVGEPDAAEAEAPETEDADTFNDPAEGEE